MPLIMQHHNLCYTSSPLIVPFLEFETYKLCVSIFTLRGKYFNKLIHIIDIENTLMNYKEKIAKWLLTYSINEFTFTASYSIL